MKALLLIFLFILGCSDKKSSSNNSEPKAVFKGNSTELKQTEIIGTLDSEIKPGKNMIWCSTLISAWKEIDKKITQEAPELLEENTLVSKLNKAKDPANYVPDEASYSNAGMIKDGILEEVKKDLAEKFPGKSMPDFKNLGPEAIIAYAYLRAGIKFDIAYHENDDSLDFKDSSGKETEVKSFGIFGHNTFHEQMASQIRVLYAKGFDEEKEFIVDLDFRSEKYQILLASVKPKKTTQEIVSYIHELISIGFKRMFHKSHKLIVPQTVWKISHSYEDLLNKKFKNPELKDYFLVRALQDIEFKLYNRGAEVESEVMMDAVKSAAPREDFDGRYIFNKPFYILMMKRGEVNPFFFMYVDNAELLDKW